MTATRSPARRKQKYSAVRIEFLAANAQGQLYISVKGYPEGRGKAQPSAQAGVWFSQAVFDIVAYRSEDAAVQLALALPDFPCIRCCRVIEPRIGRSKRIWVRVIPRLRGSQILALVLTVLDKS